MVNRNDLPTLLRKVFENGINLAELFKREDTIHQGLIERNKFYEILESLALGYGPEDIYEIFKNTSVFDAHGNADYTVILQNNIYALMENHFTRNLNTKGQSTDTRKVVIEDLIYIDNFDIIIYTTILPKSSNIYVSHTISLSQGKQEESKLESALKYKLLATLEGHTNSDPPIIYYVADTCCLISGQKDNEEPEEELSVEKKRVEQPETEVQVRRQAKKKVYELLIWNLQKSLIQLMQANPPWRIKPVKRIDAHGGPILDITYLPSSQLIVTTSTDRTIKFFDPTASPYDLVNLSQFLGNRSNPVEKTATNPSFGEVRRIYTHPATCYKLHVLNLNSNQPSTNIEWLIGLKFLDQPLLGKNLEGLITGYGVERVRLKVPAIRHDDPIPSSVYQNCANAIEIRRKKAIVAFQNFLPNNLEYLMATIRLKEDIMNKFKSLLRNATLNRSSAKTVNVKCIKEAFKLLLEVPERKLQKDSSKNKTSVLTASEVYYYLKKYSYIHPANINQVMFAKFVNALKDTKNTSTTKKWNSEAMELFAEYIRHNGLPSKPTQYTRKEFITWLETSKLALEKSQLVHIAYEIDILNSDNITLDSLEEIFKDELKYYNVRMFKRSNPIIDEIRNKVLPNKKMNLQEALGSIDEHGDGYITKQQFLKAFDRADIKIDREMLEYLFDLLGEQYILGDNMKILSIGYFLKKLFTKTENIEINQIKGMMKKILLVLEYRGMEPESVFAEVPLDKLNATTMNIRVQEVLEKSEFENRLKLLGINDLSSGEITKIANFLSLNEKNEKVQVVYLRNYLQHLKSAGLSVAELSVSKNYLLSFICTKLLISEVRLKRQCYELADVVEGYIEPSGIRTVLNANGIISSYADLFIEYFMGCVKINLEDLVAKMRAEVFCYHKVKNDKGVIVSQINYHEVLKKVFADDKNNIKPEHITEVCKKFDKQGKIKIFHLINILRHNLIGLDEMALAGIQYELSLIYPDELIDYTAYLQSFTDSFSENELSLVASKEREQQKLYDELLKRLDIFITKYKIDFRKAFELFDPKQTGKVNKEQLMSVFKWIDFTFSSEELIAIFSVGPKVLECISTEQFIQQVIQANDMVMIFNRQQWINAAKGISLEDQGRVIVENLDKLKFLIEKEYPNSQLIPGEVFMNCLHDASLGLSDEEVEMVTKYAIRGSKRLTTEEHLHILSGVTINIEKDLINFPFFSKSLKMALEMREETKEERPQFVYNPKVSQKLSKHKETNLVSKIRVYFTKTGLSFYDYFFSEEIGFLQLQLQYITKKQVMEAVRILKIPLTLQEQQMLVRLENTGNTESIPVREFCNRFESLTTLENRMNITLEKLTAAILLKDIPWDLKFDLFDKESKGYITRQDFIDLVNYWKLGLSLVEIDTMLELIGENKGESTIITREVFKERILNNFQELKNVVIEKLKQSLLIEIAKRLSRKSLIECFKDFDVEKNGKADSNTLIKVLDNIGIKGITKKELNILLEIGNVDSSLNFEYELFSKTITDKMEAEILRRDNSSIRIVENTYISLRAKKLSIFDAYCQFDVFLRGEISRLEFISSLQNMIVEPSQANINILWDTTLAEFGEGVDKMNYFCFLSMFAKRGLLMVTEPEDAACVVASKFNKQLRAIKGNLETLYASMDLKQTGRVTYKEFVNGCKKVGMKMKKEELENVYKAMEDKEFGGVTYKTLADYVQANVMDEDNVTKIYTRMYRICRKRKIDLEQVFENAKKETEDKKEEIKKGCELDNRELASVLRKERFELKQDEIELAVNNLVYNKAGLISAKEFLEQLERWDNKYTSKREEKVNLVKMFIRKVKDSLNKLNTNIEVIFLEVDQNEDGLITFDEFLEFMKKLSVDLSIKDSANIFITLAEDIGENLRVDTLNRYITSMELVDQLGLIKEVSEATEEDSYKEMLFQKIRAKLEERNTTLQGVIAKLKIDPIAHITLKSMEILFEKVDLTLSDKELETIDSEIKKTYGQPQYSYQVLIDFMVRRRVDASEIYSGNIHSNHRIN